ncbi:MAG: reverse transcriptase domain-containing protein [Candidatus Thiodiazotropha endolucinida]|nr:hypothetical protein [Candidatus Thiodiazotropha taylori]MCW4344200.1 reverse transcriptase domain-containing protein [Candidatus Thiodiazotropha endolucinida]
MELNTKFSLVAFACFFSIDFATWISILLLCSGDVHPNPGPLSSASNSSFSNSSSSSCSTVSSAIFESLSSSHSLSFIHYNVQSIISKLEILHTELIDFDILAFSETWLSASVDNDDLFIQSYNTPERKDRDGDNHGGVIIYVKEGIFYKRRVDLEIRGIESIWIEVANNNKHILFAVFYRPPNSDASYLSLIEDSIALAIDTGISDIVITGDFNLNTLSPQTSRKIESLCLQFSLHQLIDKPTNFTEHSSSILDLLFVSNEEHILLSGVGEPFLNQPLRYHCPVYGVLKFSKPKATSFTRHVWYYGKGDYNLLRQRASELDWESLYNNDTATYASNIHSAILQIARQCIPNREIKVKPTDPPWLTSIIKRHIRKRKRAYKRAKRSSSASDWYSFRKQRNKTITLIRKSKQAFYDNIKNKLASNTLSQKDWWSTLKTFIAPRTKSTVPPLEYNNEVYSDEFDKANIFNSFFQSQTILDETNAVLPDPPTVSVDTQLSRIILTPFEVESVLKSLPLGKAAGPNGLSNRILRELSSVLSRPLCSVFNQSLQTGIVPTHYKEANVCPVPKKGDLATVSNYRPISLLNSESKVLERLVFKYLFNHFRDNNQLTSLQSGFVPGDSTINQLTLLYNTFCHALDCGKEVRAVFCDISKAFDRVWHNGLIFKLQAAGVTGEVLTWFKSYLSDRKQRVVLPGTTSDWVYIRAGVPQGSILGPLLFLLYINDIVVDIGSNIRLFADDTSLFIVVDNPETAANCLNSDLSKISQWAKTWLVSFNPSKTESLLISRKRNQPQHPPIIMQNQAITEVEHHKHLGVYFSRDGTWHQHINYITEKAWTRINVMRKLKFKLDRKSLETIYLVFIRPLLEYGDIIWSNCTQYEKDELEKIQTEAARIATGTTKLISRRVLYTEIRWESLEQRRKHHQLTLFYKMINHLTPAYLTTLIPQSVSSLSRYNLRNSNDLQTIDARTNQYYHSFLPSAIRAWNSLPIDAQQSNTVNSFKSFLKKGEIKVPKYYYTGHRKEQILHTRLRTNCSSLNLDLFMKNISDSPMCRCGSIEDAQHYFFHCAYYTLQRDYLLNSISMHTIPSLNVLLFGDSSLSFESNTFIFDQTQKFIKSTKRF